MTNRKFICPKCGGRTRIEKRVDRVALICKENGHWIKWLGKAEIREFESQPSDDGVYLVLEVFDPHILRPTKLFAKEQTAIDWVASQDYPQDFSGLSAGFLYTTYGRRGQLNNLRG